MQSDQLKFKIFLIFILIVWQKEKKMICSWENISVWDTTCIFIYVMESMYIYKQIGDK